MTGIRWTVLTLVLVSMPLRTLAEPPSPKAQSDQLISEGIELRRQHKDEEALERFRKALDLAPSPRAHAQVGFAEQAIGLWDEAEADLKLALQNGQDPWVIKNRELIDQALNFVSDHLGDLKVNGSPAGAQVTLNGKSVGKLPLDHALRIPVGSATLEVAAPGYLPTSRTVVIASRSLARELVKLVPLTRSEEASPVADEGPRPETRRYRLAGWTLFGTGAALMGVGIAGSAVRADYAHRWNSDACVANGLSRSENCSGDLNTAQLGQNLTISGFVAGGALVATSIALLIKGYVRPHRRIVFRGAQP